MSGSPTILIVDDDEGIRSVLAQVLRSKTVNVVTAATPEEGLEEMKRIPPPDFIFLDLGFAGIDGRPTFYPEDTISMIPEFRKYNKRAPIVILSGLLDDKLNQMTKAIGVDAVRSKPLVGQLEVWKAVQEGIRAREASGESLYEATTKLVLEMQERINQAHEANSIKVSAAHTL